VPPTDKLPTHIIGKLKDTDLIMFLSKRKLRIITTRPYNNEKGKRRILNDLSR
jgi:hypothetical protein